MKMKLLQKKGSSLAAMFTAVVIACLGLAQQVEAAVTWTVDQVGADLVMTTSGMLQFFGSGLFPTDDNTTDYSGDQNLGGYLYDYYDFGGGFGVNNNDGKLYMFGRSVVVLVDGFVGREADVYSGDTFGVWGGQLLLVPGVWDNVVRPISSMTFFNTHYSDVFGGNLDSGPVAIWTGDYQWENVYVALGQIVAVPEPSSAAMFGLGGFALMLRRRR